MLELIDGKICWGNPTKDMSFESLFGQSRSVNDLMDFSIHFSCPVLEETTEWFLEELESKIEKAILFKIDYGIEMPIPVYINSPGGYVGEGFRIVRAIEQSAIPVHTIADNLVASMGLTILLAGHKRFAYPRTEFLAHNISAGMEGKMYDITAHYNALLECERELKLFYTKQTALSGIKIDGLFSKESFFYTKDAVEMNFVHQIIEKSDGVEKRI